MNFVCNILSELAAELGVEIHIEPRYGHVGRVVRPDGQSRYFRATVFDLNGAGSTEIAVDKDYAAYFLKSLGYPVPDGDSFHTFAWARAIGSDRTPDRAWEYAQALGLPVFVKPNSMSKGYGVALAHDQAEFLAAIETISRMDRVFLVQRPVHGHDYRIVVLDGDVISAYERRPLRVIGDGATTVRGLLEAKQRAYVESGRDTRVPFEDGRIAATLKRHGLTENDVLPDGMAMTLLPNANLSSGGDAVDVTTSVHPEWRALSARLARDMNLRYIGIDVITPTGLDRPPGEYVVIEINAAPGLDNYAAIGPAQERVVKDLYRRVLLAMLD